MGRPRKPLTEQRGNLTVITMQTREAEEDSVTTDKNQLDRNNLGGYCNAFANYVKATEILKDQTYYIDRETRNGVIVVKNPMVDIQRTYAEEMRKFASLCGLTIDARLKAAAVKSDKTREAITNKFGNI